jgi:hypothetical protein
MRHDESSMGMKRGLMSEGLSNHVIPKAKLHREV